MNSTSKTVFKLQYFALLVMILLTTISEAEAQFVDLRLNIDSKISVQTERSLNFGTLATNTGRQMIELGSVNMGIFSITALENQLLLVTLDKPTELIHNNPTIGDEIPLELFSRYGYSAQNYENSYSLPGSTSTIKVEPNPEPGPWNSIYLFMYGAINLGDVPDGTYSNQIILNVEYI